MKKYKKKVATNCPFQKFNGKYICVQKKTSYSDKLKICKYGKNTLLCDICREKLIKLKENENANN